MNYLVIEFVEGNESKWKDVLEYIFPKASHIEFNILYSDKRLEEFLKEFENSNVEITKKKKKTYSSGRVIRMRLTNQVIEFMKGKSFSDFRNWFLEDPSFYIENKEIVATITHEDQIYLNPKYIDLDHFSHFNLKHRLIIKNEEGFWQRILKLFSQKN